MCLPPRELIGYPPFADHDKIVYYRKKKALSDPPFHFTDTSTESFFYLRIFGQLVEHHDQSHKHDHDKIVYYRKNMFFLHSLTYVSASRRRCRTCRRAAHLGG
jgi:hypothetical protein